MKVIPGLDPGGGAAAPSFDEFGLIRQFFAQDARLFSECLRLGIGDDCALLKIPPHQELAISTDTLIAGRHFPVATRAVDIGWKALAVNLSDLAAMGASPLAFLLALSLPQADPDWLQDFAAGLRELSGQHRVSLIGGDTTRGALSITITVLGCLPAGQALLRSGARPGDDVCVTGTLGDAALALNRLQSASPANEQLDARLARPEPRIAAGLALRGLAHAAIDLSDGLSGDLKHVLHASGVGATIDIEALPASAAFDAHVMPGHRLALQVAGGDDYELCVCIAPEQFDTARQRVFEACNLNLTRIGRITASPGLRCLTARGLETVLPPDAYQHF